MIFRSTILASAFLASAVVSARADDLERPATRDAARPAVGEWVGTVSWNDPPVTYSWAIFPDGTFTSGFSGSVHNGGGAWGTHGARLFLKYDDGFRYEGELRGETFAGTAYAANGRPFGSFYMSQASEAAAIEEAP